MAITSQRSGNWLRDAVNADSPWYGGGIASGVPTSADDVIIGTVATAVAITNASPCVITLASHGLANDDIVVMSANGTPSAGIVLGQQYYVVWLSASTFGLSTTPGGGNRVNTTSASSAMSVNRKYHDVTLDGTGCVCNTLTVHATLRASTTVASDLKAQRDITWAQGSSIYLDVSSVPAIRHRQIMNGLANGTNFYGIIKSPFSSVMRLKGALRKRHTRTQAALTGQTSNSVVVDDATGWEVGDIIVFGDTQPWSATAFNPTAISYSDPYITVTCTSTTGLLPGHHLALAALAPTTLNRDWVVHDVLSGTQYRINVGTGLAAITDGVGTATRMAKTDKCTVTAISVIGAGPDATITFTGEAGGNVAWDHADRCYVGNMSSNLEITSSTISQSEMNRMGGGLNVPMSKYMPDASLTIQDVLFNGAMANYYAGGSVYFFNSAGAGSTTTWDTISNNAFYQTAGYDFSWQYSDYTAAYPIEDNVFYSEMFPTYYRATFNISSYGTISTKPWLRNMLFRAHNFLSTNALFGEFRDCLVSGCFQAALASGSFAGSPRFTNTTIISSNQAITPGSFGTDVQFDNCDIGSEFGATCYTAIGGAGNGRMTLNGTQIQPLRAPADVQSYTGRDFSLMIKDRNGDADLQELYKRPGTIYRDVSGSPAAVNGDATMRFEPKLASLSLDYVFEVLVPVGSTLVFKGNSRRNSSTMSITVAASLNGVTVGSTFDHAAAADTWESFSIDLSHAEASSQVILVTASVSDSTNITTSKGYIDGVPDYPFINKVRWYGWLYDETSKTRTANSAITETDEAIAYAYTGIAVGTGTAPALTGITLSVDHSFVELYDYTQAWARANIGYNVPITASVVGLLTATCNLTINTTKVLSGAGSILMGSYTLSTEFAGAIAYTYTGGTWSQTLTVPTFSGGTLTLPTAITMSPGFTMSSGEIVFDATSALWDLSTCTIDSGVTLSNSSGDAITVAMPSGYPAGVLNPGTAEQITVVAAVNTLTIAGSVTLLGAEVCIYDHDNTPAGSFGTLIDRTESCPGATYSIPLSAGNLVMLQIIKAGYVEFTQEYTMGASATFTAILQPDTEA